MRVLDPAVKNPVYKLHHKATESMGDAGTLATITTLGVLVPVSSGVLFDSIFSLISMLGWYGLLSFRGYKKHTKNKTRLTVLVKLRNGIPDEYHYVIDPMIKEVYDCPNDHYDFKEGSQGYRYYAEIERNSFSMRTVQFKETPDQWEQRRKEEKILKVGHGCKYCGDRIAAATLLKTQCIAAKVEDNSSVENALSVVESKRIANDAMLEFAAIYTPAQKELMP